MTNYRRLARYGAVVGVAALALAACGSSSTSGSAAPSASSGGGVKSAFNAAVTQIVNVSSKTGGTLKLGAGGDCDSWDPARTYYAWCWDMQRLFSRTLMSYSHTPGTDGTKVSPDLATAPGTASADKKTWTYHLSAGLKWDDGAPITSSDIKYAMERLYATDVINGGPTFYYLCLLDTCNASGTPKYVGPYKDKTGQPMVNGAPSMDTPDATTITFHLASTYSDWDYLMAVAASAPVPQKRDTGNNYTKAPASSGPFMIDKYDVGKSISFKRNPNWSQATDKIRSPKVNAIDMTIITDPDAADKALQNGTIDLEPDGGVQASFRAQIDGSPTLKAQADNPVTGFTRYLVVTQTVAPLTNVHCRRAIFYAINKADLRTARGGSYGGDIANTMTPPNIPGYDATANAYPNGTDNTGDLTKAKAELTQCGQPSGFTINMAYVNKGAGTKVFVATQNALARVGIKVVSAPGDQASYYSTYIGSPANIVAKKLGILVAGWGADFPTGNGFWNSIVNGTAILPTGNSNYASLNDPVINGLLTQGLTETDPTKLANIYKQVDAEVMQDAVMLPFQFDKTLYWHTARLTNLYLQAGLGYYYDYVNVGVSDGK
jgi:peptide/nickel transport system substrate-binding protein